MQGYGNSALHLLFIISRQFQIEEPVLHKLIYPIGVKFFAPLSFKKVAVLLPFSCRSPALFRDFDEMLREGVLVAETGLLKGGVDSGTHQSGA